MRRYPIVPLEEYMGGAESLAATVGVTERTVYRRRHNGLDEKLADEWAVRCGLNPYAVWETWAEDELAAVEAAEEALRRACADCPETFIPARQNQLYCSSRCRGRAAHRRWAQRHRDKVQRLNRAWREENRDYLAGEARRYRQRVQSSERRRERYATDPEYRQRVLDQRKQYKARKRGEAA